MALGKLASIISLLVLHFTVTFVTDFNYLAIFNFGDSNSDTGGLIAGLNAKMEFPYGENYFKKLAGQFCDGRLIIDFLSRCKHKFLTSPKEKKKESKKEAKQMAAARISSSLIISILLLPCYFVLSIAFNHSTTLTLDALTPTLASGSRAYSQAEILYWACRQQIQEIHPSSRFFFSKGLYMFDIGQNDLAGAFYSQSEDQVLASVTTILSEFETGLKKSYDHGARRFWVHDAGPLGCSPQNIAAFGKDLSKLDELGCVSSHNRAAKLFNLQLHALCTRLQAGFGDANVAYVDIFTIKSNLIANHSKYGFSNPIAACCEYGGPPLNYDSRVGCGQTKILNGSSITANRCSDPTKYVNWDDIHYTEAANLHVSSQILTGKYSDPPFSDKMPFLLKLKF